MKVGSGLGLIAIVMLVLGVGPRPAGALTADERALYAVAFESARAEDWATARFMASRTADPLVEQTIEWMRLTAEDSGAVFADYLDFVQAAPEWGDHYTLRRRAEEVLSVMTPAPQIEDWFADRRPVTPRGAMELARVMIATGRADEARDLIQASWIEMNFDARDERNFLVRFGVHLTLDDHEARTDRLIWARAYTAAERMYPRLDVGYRALAEARIKLGRMRGGVDAAIERVPTRLRDNPGLIFERLRWRRRKGLDDAALSLLWTAPDDPDNANRWWIERRYHARRLLENGAYGDAYRLAAAHGQVDGFVFASGEWLAGWIALRFLADPELAYRHFTTMHANVGFPVSLSRAAYWAGRAAEDRGLAQDASDWYAAAARYVATYYGQLAAARLPSDRRSVFVRPPATDANLAAAFRSRLLVRTAQRLVEIDEHEVAGDVLRHVLGTAETSEDRLLTGEVALGLGLRDVAVRASRRSYQDGLAFVPSGYPVLPIAAIGDMELALTHAVIRQESGFEVDAISSAGARGLMQLMPATARRTAISAGLSYSKERLTDDANYNVALGQHHLLELLDEYGGSVALSLAAYNAGPHRADRWLGEYGDPRTGAVDPIDWVELIPFYETRNYVQRVLENLQVYRWLLHGTPIATVPHDSIFIGGYADN